MKQISSSKFRTNYQYLTEDHEVTANSRIIGRWEPVSPIARPIDLDEPMKIEFRPVPKPMAKKRKRLL